jgi:hypothetical protein
MTSPTPLNVFDTTSVSTAPMQLSPPWFRTTATVLRRQSTPYRVISGMHNPISRSEAIPTRPFNLPCHITSPHS